MGSTGVQSFNVSVCKSTYYAYPLANDSQQSGNGRFKATEVNVAVSQDIQMDKMETSQPESASFYGDDRKTAAIA